MNPSFIIIYIVIIGVFAYFFVIRPSQKTKKEKEQLKNSLKVGDLVKTTAGFYGEVIDLTEEMVIVEFGNNRNCRIPMDRDSIVDIERAEEQTEKAD